RRGRWVCLLSPGRGRGLLQGCATRLGVFRLCKPPRALLLMCWRPWPTRTRIGWRPHGGTITIGGGTTGRRQRDDLNEPMPRLYEAASLSGYDRRVRWVTM